MKLIDNWYECSHHSMCQKAMQGKPIQIYHNWAIYCVRIHYTHTIKTHIHTQSTTYIIIYIPCKLILALLIDLCKSMIDDEL